mgnify:CR=1 FL=1
MNVVSKIGQETVNRWRALVYLCAAIFSVLRLAVKPRFWPRTVRNVLARQILFTGFEAVRFVSLVAFMVGISVVVQAQVWLTKFGQSALLGPILVMVVIREVGPLLANFVVIGRSGTAIATELGNMNVAGEIRVMDAMGLDPFSYLVLPRVIGMAVSIFCLTVVFIVVSFFSGYVCGMLAGVHIEQPGLFIDSVFKSVRPADVFNLVAKTLIPGLMTGTVCCMEGLSAETITEVPQAATRAVVRSITYLFITSALVSLLTYL